MTDPLAEWRSGIDPVLARLRDAELPAGFPLDFSPASLSALEAVLLERFPAGARFGGEDLAESAVAYVGEALLLVGGGDWEWADGPVVRFDDALDLEPVSPLRLLGRVVRSRTGVVLAHAHAAVLEAVSRQQLEDPGWAPSRGVGAGGGTVIRLPRRP
ncbi:hypothetical protein ACFV4N_11790 [Actinosynnema sp. NPDC059797]